MTRRDRPPEVRKARLRRALLYALAILALGAASGALAAQAGAAPAPWVGVNGCRLHAYLPYLDSHGYVEGAGKIDTCGGLTGEANMQLEVCARVWGGGVWNTKQSTCYTLPYTYASSEGAGFNPFIGVPGHEYVTWTYAKVNGKTGTYQSSPWTEP